MKKSFLTFILLISSSVFNAISADGIRLYQQEDYECLKGMLAGNPDLLLPGNNLHEQVEQTAKHFGSKNYTTKVFVKDNKPVGFITYQNAFRTPQWLFKMISGSAGAIQLLNVVQEYHRQGIGSALLTDTLTDMKNLGFKKVMVATKVTNIASRALYEKHGFQLAFPIAPGVSDCFYTCKL